MQRLVALDADRRWRRLDEAHDGEATGPGHIPDVHPFTALAAKPVRERILRLLEEPGVAGIAGLGGRGHQQREHEDRAAQA
jgi:hypothetical protein